MRIETVMKKYEGQLMELPNVTGIGVWEKGLFSKESFVIAKAVADT